MLSEWLVEVPVDIVDKWLLILCPEVGVLTDDITSCDKIHIHTSSFDM